MISALGARYAGMFGNNENLNNALRSAGKKVNEEVW
jgi:leucyl aminopeptidase